MNYYAQTPRLPFHLRLSCALIVIYFLLMAAAPPPTIDAYFEKIRTNRAALTAFFSQMPKGGDLHNHLSGAVYAEYFLNVAIDQKLWVNLKTLALSAQPPAAPDGYVRIDTFCVKREYADLKQRLLQDWSVKDFYAGFAPTDKHFFDAFNKFPRLPGWDDTHRALMVLKRRAQAENVQYLEVMIGSCPFNFDVSPFRSDETGLRAFASYKDTTAINNILQRWYDAMQAEATRSAQTFSDELTAMHRGLDEPSRGPSAPSSAPGAPSFTMRYQASIRREAPPADIFRSLLASFKAAEISPLIGGVNFVSREDGDLAMQDYYLHMLMFRFLHRKCPAARYSLHAGELTLGLVEPEDLTWHINEAVLTAGANRIGHGVDLPYENNNRSLMQYMSRTRTAVEINLASNEFILGVRDDAHPVQLYADNKVPIVLSTDDPGILRTNLTEQFVLLAMRYRLLRYADIRQFVLNSIEYSFIKDARLKQQVMGDLNNRLAAFERDVVL